MELWQELAVALALGLLIGIERGWQEREAAEGTRVAGVRTFGLIGLLGGLWALLSQLLGELMLGFALLAFAAALITAHYAEMQQHRVYGTTTMVAALITFALGALSVLGYMEIAAASAVVTATLLGMKPVLHRWLLKLERGELFAGFKLLLISVVLLPLLPDKGFGPWGALNPYELWWLVVLIAAISFLGYFAIKIAGTQLGVVLTGLFGGLASSTAVTLNFSRLGKRNKSAQTLLAAGVVVASATMFPRILLVVSVVNIKLLPALAVPLGAMTAVAYLGGAWLWRTSRSPQKAPEIALSNPFELSMALQFGLLLVVVLLLSKAFQQWFGDLGVYLIAAFSGLSDVDAITLSLSRLAENGLAPPVAAQGIVLAAMVNTAVKGGLVLLVCCRSMAYRVIAVLTLAVLAGAAGLVLWH